MKQEKIKGTNIPGTLKRCLKLQCVCAYLTFQHSKWVVHLQTIHFGLNHLAKEWCYFCFFHVHVWYQQGIFRLLQELHETFLSTAALDLVSK